MRKTIRSARYETSIQITPLINIAKQVMNRFKVRSMINSVLEDLMDEGQIILYKRGERTNHAKK